MNELNARPSFSVSSFWDSGGPFHCLCWSVSPWSHVANNPTLSGPQRSSRRKVVQGPEAFRQVSHPFDWNPQPISNPLLCLTRCALMLICAWSISRFPLKDLPSTFVHLFIKYPLTVCMCYVLNQCPNVRGVNKISDVKYVLLKLSGKERILCNHTNGLLVQTLFPTSFSLHQKKKKKVRFDSSQVLVPFWLNVWCILGPLWCYLKVLDTNQLSMSPSFPFSHRGIINKLLILRAWWGLLGVGCVVEMVFGGHLVQGSLLSEEVTLNADVPSSFSLRTETMTDTGIS